MTKEYHLLEELEKVVKKLLASNREITLVIITSLEGLPIISVLPRKYDEKMCSAMVATLLSLSEKTVVDMDIGLFKQIYIKGNDGYILVFDAELAVLAVSTTRKAQLGLVFLECERAVDKLSKILKNEN